MGTGCVLGSPWALVWREEGRGQESGGDGVRACCLACTVAELCVVIDWVHFLHKSEKQINVSRQWKASCLMNGPCVSAANLGRSGRSQGGERGVICLR